MENYRQFSATECGALLAIYNRKDGPCEALTGADLRAARGLQKMGLVTLRRRSDKATVGKLKAGGVAAAEALAVCFSVTAERVYDLTAATVAVLEAIRDHKPTGDPAAPSSQWYPKNPNDRKAVDILKGPGLVLETMLAAATKKHRYKISRAGLHFLELRAKAAKATKVPASKRKPPAVASFGRRPVVDGAEDTHGGEATHD